MRPAVATEEKYPGGSIRDISKSRKRARSQEPSEETATTWKISALSPEGNSGGTEKLPEGVKLDQDTLTTEQATELRTLLKTYEDIFAENPKKPAITTRVTHRIDTGENRPVHQPPYRKGPEARKIVREEVQRMLQDNIIRPSRSPWAAPVVLVKKKDGSIRFCVDYRKLNAVTKRDVYPLPRIDDALDAFSNAKFFSTLDLASGYWQVPIEDEDKEKAAFICEEVHQDIRQGLTLTRRVREARLEARDMLLEERTDTKVVHEVCRTISGDREAKSNELSDSRSENGYRAECTCQPNEGIHTVACRPSGRSRTRPIRHPRV